MGRDGFMQLLAQYVALAQQNANGGGDAGRMGTAGATGMRQAPVGMGGNTDWLREYAGGALDNAPGLGSGAWGMGAVGNSQMGQAPVGMGGNTDYMRGYRGPAPENTPAAGSGAYGMGDVGTQQIMALLALLGK